MMKHSILIFIKYKYKYTIKTYYSYPFETKEIYYLYSIVDYIVLTP